MRFLLTISILVTALGLSGLASADVYKFVDGSGHVVYTDKPKHRGFKLIIRTPVSVMLARRSQPAPLSRNFSFSRASERGRLAYSPLIEETADRYDLDPALLHAVIRAESAYNPGAVSNKGAAGLMQLMPATAERFGVRDRFDPAENIEGGARYLSELLDMFSDVRLAVAAYNSGENTVKKFGYQIPPIAETQDYVAKVLNYYRR
ncbi:lytic transglycosylase domain-containing protein [Methyloterricola oryzae]|uniref:lytic transglycosylase domain-containing protein n=1 Tax=Methyloterricola oryzae TaxID=1495050 RepID=UPI0005EB21A6|nr:lytic transglycosylase domain-containing protein [Methyloterricola oryzae]